MTYRGFAQPDEDYPFMPDDVVVDGDWLARELDVLDSLRAIVAEWEDRGKFSERHFNAHRAMVKVREAMKPSVHEPHDAGLLPSDVGGAR